MVNLLEAIKILSPLESVTLYLAIIGVGFLVVFSYFMLVKALKRGV